MVYKSAGQSATAPSNIWTPFHAPQEYSSRIKPLMRKYVKNPGETTT